MTSPNFFVADLSQQGDPHHTLDGYEIGTECQNAGQNGFPLDALYPGFNSADVNIWKYM